MKTSITDFWEAFKSDRKEFSDTALPKVDHFCNDEENTNLCSQLVNDGIKTATCSAKILYDLNKETLPQIGTLILVTDWSGNPVCVIRTTKIELKKFEEINEVWARKEGEGDFSLACWRDAHEKFFRAVLNEHGIDFQKDLILVCEEFEKL